MKSSTLALANRSVNQINEKPMPRQNFLSRESFVVASELQAKESLLSVPAFVPNIKLISENHKLQSFKFRYQLPQRNLEYHVDVTILPLDTQYTRISLHGEYSNGHAFENDADMNLALCDFESAIEAALKGDVSNYKPYKPKETKQRNFLQLTATLAASVGVFILRKKLS
jgi:hypothetical protein